MENTNCNELLLGMGASTKYIDDCTIKNSGKEIFYQNFNHPIYPQTSREFIKGVSIIDLLFNVKRQEAINLISNSGTIEKEIDILILLDSKAVDYSSDPRVFRTAYFLWQNGYKVAVLGFQSTPELIQLEEKLTIHNIIPEEIFSFKSIFGKRKEVAQTINNTFSYKYIIANDHLMLSIGRIMKNYNPKSKLIYDSHELFQDYQLEFFNNESFSVKLKSHIWRWIEKKMEKNDVKYADKVIASNDSIAKVFESIFKLKK